MKLRATDTPDGQQTANKLPVDHKDADLWDRLAGRPGQDFRVSLLHRLRISGAGPDAFAIHMRTIMPVNRQRGERMMRGLWQIGMERLQTDDGASPWNMTMPSRHYADRLHRFGWVGDLLSQGQAGASRARYLIDDWIDKFGQFDKFAWRPDCTADRAWNWLQCGPELFERGNTSAFRSRVQSLDLQIRHIIACTIHGTASPGLRWRAGVLGVARAICLAVNTTLDDALIRLENECQAQILPDGGHCNRAPEAALNVLADLIMLQDLLARTDRTIPGFITRSIDRTGNMIRFFRAGDGGLVPFNDSGESSPETVNAVLQHLETPRRFDIAIKSGFQKLRGNDSQLIIDVGQSPPPPFADQAHAGTLGFELHDGPARIITSCGSSPDIGIELREAVRRTCAHSTLAPENTDCATFLVNRGTRLLYPKGPGGISVKRLEEKDQGTWLDTGHGGYKNDFGLYYRRRLFMSANGTRLVGEDSLISPPDGQKRTLKTVAYALRFHIHPDTTVHVTGDSIILRNRHGMTWRFITSHAGTHLDKTLYLARGTAESGQQIVLTGKAHSDGDGTKPANCIRWSFMKTDGT